MPPPGRLRLRVIKVGVLAVELLILGSKLKVLDLLVTEHCFTHHISLLADKSPPSADRPTMKALQTQICHKLIVGDMW